MTVHPKINEYAIVLVSRHGTGNNGGVERVVSLIAADLLRRGIQFELIEERTLLPRWTRHWRINQYVFPIWASWWLLHARRKGKRFLTISNTSYTPLYPAEIVIVHGSALGFIKAMRSTKKKFWGMRLLAKFEALTMRIAHNNACVSEYVQDLAVNLYNVDPSKCTVIHNGIDTSIFQVLPKFEGGIVRLGFAGRLEEAKGLAYLLTIANWVSQTQNVRLILAAIGPVPEQLSNMPNVTVLTDVLPEKMANFYNNIDIFLLPSLFEGFELVTLEALASGVCIVGREVGACKTFLDRKIPWVYRLPPNPIEFITHSHKIFLALQTAHDGQAMRAFIKEEFSIQQFCSKLYSLMESNNK